MIFYLKILFIISIVFIFYAYIGYPVSLIILGMLKDKTKQRGNYRPNITIIITAYNEEKRIKEKIENTLEISYPRGNLQILIASDGSSDRTNEIAAGFRERGIELLALAERGGKENAQKEAIKHARGEILVFTDVATMLDPTGIEQIVSNFTDPAVGCVSSEDQVIGKDGKKSGEGFYVRYEMWLRRLESRVYSLVGLSGSFFAARKIVCLDFSGDTQSDFRTLLNSVRMGLRGISDPKAIGYYLDGADQRREFDRKVRTVLRGITVFFRNTEFLNLLKYGVFSYQYFCHKLLRWLVPVFLVIALVTNFFLAVVSNLFFIVLIGQISFYLLALIGRQGKHSSTWVLLKIPCYFFTVNASIIVAWFRYFKHERIVMWTPSER